ncbi:unnamed protein product [Lampetra planeri]
MSRDESHAPGGGAGSRSPLKSPSSIPDRGAAATMQTPQAQPRLMLGPDGSRPTGDTERCAGGQGRCDAAWSAMAITTITAWCATMINTWCAVVRRGDHGVVRCGDHGVVRRGVHRVVGRGVHRVVIMAWCAVVFTAWWAVVFTAW